MRWISAVSVIFAALSGCMSTPRGPDMAAVAADLQRMVAEDQAVRASVPSNPELIRPEHVLAMQTVDQRNTARLKQIVAQYGWPSVALVGPEASHAAWLLVQHADAEPAFQRRVLALMEPLARSGAVAGRDYAYLWDRTHKPQRFGTQGRCLPNGGFELFPVEDPARVDVRRAAYHLAPLATYLQLATSMCGEPTEPDDSSTPAPPRGTD